MSVSPCGADRRRTSRAELDAQPGPSGVGEIAATVHPDQTPDRQTARPPDQDRGANGDANRRPASVVSVGLVAFAVFARRDVIA